MRKSSANDYWSLLSNHRDNFYHPYIYLVSVVYTYNSIWLLPDY